MIIREIYSEADVRRLTKVAREVWREANVAFCTPEQVEYMIEKFQSFEAISGQMMHGYRYFSLRRAMRFWAISACNRRAKDCC